MKINYLYLKLYKNNKYFKKNKIKKLMQRNKIKNTPNLSKNFVYFPVYWTGNVNFHSFLNYSAYQNSIISIKYKFYSIKYIKLLEFFKKTNKTFKYKYERFFSNNYIVKSQIINKIINYANMYNLFFSSFYTDLFHFFKNFKIYKQKINHYLILNFIKNKLFMNLQNFSRKNYLFLSTGLFIKFFEKKKSFKKNKTIKMLMAKYMRKLFLISHIKTTSLIIKKTPVFLIEIINLLNSPIAHKFIDPVDNKIIEEDENDALLIKFSYFIFLQSIDFSLNKGKKRGRIKRKILRKIVFENKITD